MADFDLDAARAARQRTKKTTADKTEYTFTFGGEEFSIPVDPPWGFIEAMFTGDRYQSSFLGVRAILGEQYERWISHRPDVEDGNALVEKALELYGFRDEGESLASGGSSSRSSSRSRRTSNGSTRSTSRKSSGDAKG